MIERLQQGTGQAVLVMREGQKQAGISVEQSEQASQALALITQAIAHISDMSSHIATAAEEQSAATEKSIAASCTSTSPRIRPPGDRHGGSDRAGTQDVCRPTAFGNRQVPPLITQDSGFGRVMFG